MLLMPIRETTFKKYNKKHTPHNQQSWLTSLHKNITAYRHRQSMTNVESLTLRPDRAVFYATNSRLVNTSRSYETVPIGIPRHLPSRATFYYSQRDITKFFNA